MPNKARRYQLHELLSAFVPTHTDTFSGEELPNLYFQPPSSVRMVYPCIVYARAKLNVKHADNKPYLMKDCYSVTVIDEDPDSEIPGKVAALPLCSFERHYTADNLNHDRFNLYF